MTEVLLEFKKKCIFQILSMTEETLKKCVQKMQGSLINGLIPVVCSEINVQNLRNPLKKDFMFWEIDF